MEKVTNFNETPTWMELLDPPLSEDPIELRVAVVIVLIIILVVGVVGNVACCVVILGQRSMRTVTNLYLLNLAVSDLLYILAMFLDMYFVWNPKNYPFGIFGCRMHIFVYVCLINNGVMTILALTIERYFAICHPLLLMAQAKSRVLKVLIIIWILSIAISAFDSYETQAKIAGKFFLCAPTTSDGMRFTNGVLAILIFVVPMIIIGVIYTLIALKLNKKTQSIDATFNKAPSRRRATRMLIVLTVSFFVCWFPHFVLRVMLFLSYNPTWNVLLGKIFRVLYYLWIINSWLSTAVNPIIFSIMSDQFQRAFKTLLNKRNIRKQSICFIKANAKPSTTDQATVEM